MFLYFNDPLTISNLAFFHYNLFTSESICTIVTIVYLKVKFIWGIKMLSFHNDQEIKEKYLNRVIKHRELDNLIQGTGWENGKGCAVGCTLENYDHSRYPIELGLPEWLARLEDRIFEGLPRKEAILWPERFLESIPVGINLEKIKHMLAIKRLDNLIIIQN